MSTSTFDGLTALQGFPFAVHASTDIIDKAQSIAERCNRAYRFFEDIFHTSPHITVFVLNSDDWSTYGRFPVYGMPHTTNAQTLVVAGQENDFWQNLVPDLATVAPALLRQLHTALPQSAGTVNLSPFFDLLVVHELAHLFHNQAYCILPRLWTMELFANLCLHAYIATIEPEQLLLLETIPQLFTLMKDDQTPHRSLHDFEIFYTDVGAHNYVWYQGRFHHIAKSMFDREGITALQNLWKTFLITDEQLAAQIKQQISPALAEAFVHWLS